MLRSGRFGVGVLAAYLLGNEVTVSTRYINEPEDNGISFTTELDAETIELQKIKRPVGSTVRVRIPKKVKDELLEMEIEVEGEMYYRFKWDWYCLSDPEVLLLTDHWNLKLRQEYQIVILNIKGL